MTDEQLALLEKALQKLRHGMLASCYMTENEYEPVAKYVRTAVSRAMGTGSEVYAEVDGALDHGFNYAYEHENARMRMESIERAIMCIETAIDLEKEFGARPVVTPEEAIASSKADDLVFLVHGHDIGALRSVEAFVRKLFLTPVILRDEPNLGRTLVEKLEANSAVRYAIVIMSGDDVGGARGGELKPRARQNVVLELGYFAALLKRSNLAVLYQQGVEMPSDFDGVAYIELDQGEGWHLKLVKELRAAGLAVSI